MLSNSVPEVPEIVPPSAWRLNDPSVWTGEELAFVTVIPVHPVVLSGKPPQHLQYLPASPGGVDGDGLNDDSISLVCVHAYDPFELVLLHPSETAVAVAGHGDYR